MGCRTTAGAPDAALDGALISAELRRTSGRSATHRFGDLLRLGLPLMLDVYLPRQLLRPDAYDLHKLILGYAVPLSIEIP